jgi:hypothetical protein
MVDTQHVQGHAARGRGRAHNSGGRGRARSGGQ